jgi:Zn-dependent protease
MRRITPGRYNLRRMNLESMTTVELGRPFGVPLRAHVNGLIVLNGTNFAAALVLGRVARPDWSPLTLALVAALVALLLQLSAVVHEYAHLLVALRTGRPVGTLVLTAFGGCVFVDAADECVDALRATALTVAAGPLASLALWALFGLGSDLLRDASPVLALACGAASALNMVLVALNLMPVEPLDGGRLIALARRAWAASSAAPSLAED